MIEAPWSSYGRSKGVFLVLTALFILSPALAGHFGVFHAVSYRGSHSRDWCEVSFSFVSGFVAKTQDPSSLAPRFAGFTVSAQPNVRQSQWENCYILCRRSGVTWSVLLRIVSDASGSFLPQGVARRSYRRPLSPPGSGCRCHGYASSRLRNGLFVFPLSSVHSCCRSVSSLRRTLLSSWWEGEDVALAHILAVLLLRGSCSSVPRLLPPGLCGGSAGPGFTRACSPRHIAAY